MVWLVSRVPFRCYIKWTYNKMKQQRIFEVYVDEIPINNNTNCQIVDLELFIVSFKEY